MLILKVTLVANSLSVALFVALMSDGFHLLQSLLFCHQSVNRYNSSFNSHTGKQPHLLHVTLVDGFCCFKKSLSRLRLIPACPKDAQLVLNTQTSS